MTGVQTCALPIWYQPSAVLVQTMDAGCNQVADDGSDGADDHQSHDSGDNGRDQGLGEELDRLGRHLVSYRLYAAGSWPEAVPSFKSHISVRGR